MSSVTNKPGDVVDGSFFRGYEVREYRTGVTNTYVYRNFDFIWLLPIAVFVG